MNILLAEDHDFMRELIAEILAEAGHNVTICDQGNVAITGAVSDLDNIDVVVTDFEMDGGDGAKLANTLRAHGFTGRIICQTGEPKLAENSYAPFDAIIDKSELICDPNALLKLLYPSEPDATME